MRQLRQRMNRFRSQTTLVQLRLHRQQRAALYPAMTDVLILRQPIPIPGGAQELIGAPNAVPLFLDEANITAGHGVFAHGDQIERSGVR